MASQISSLWEVYIEKVGMGDEFTVIRRVGSEKTLWYWYYRHVFMNSTV